MANQFHLNAVITAVNRVSGPMQGVLRSLRSPVNALKNLGSATLGLGQQVAGLLGPMAALGGVLTVAGVGKLVTDFVATTDQLAKQAKRIGVSVESLQELRYAADMAGVSQEGLEKSLQKLNVGIVDAAGGKNKELSALFGKMNISLRGANGQIRSAADLMPELAETFAKTENPALRAKMATLLFGKSGQELITMLGEGGPALQKMAEEARKYGVITAEEAELAEQVNDAQGRLNATMRGLGNQISAKILPAVLKFTDRLTEWVTANKAVISTKFDGFITRISERLDAFDWDAFMNGITMLIDFTFRAADAVGGFDKILIGIVALMNTSLIGTFLKVGAAFAKLGMAFLTNPIGLAVAVIAGLIYLIYDNWDGIVAWFDNKIAAVKAAFDVGFIQGIGSLFANFFPLKMLMDAIDGLVFKFTGIDLYKEGEQIINSLWDGIKAIWNNLTGWVDEKVKWITDQWDGAVKMVTDSPVGKVIGVAADAAGAVAEAAGLTGETRQIDRVVGKAPQQAVSSSGLGLNGETETRYIDRVIEKRPESEVLPRHVPQVPLAAAQQAPVKGEMQVRFVNAPPGMRVDEGKTNQPGFGLSSNVGYATVGGS